MSRWYTWELQGRGYQIYDHPVHLEPALVPFSFIPTKKLIDDGKQHTPFSFVGDFLRASNKIDRGQPNIEAIPFTEFSTLQILKIRLSRDSKTGISEIDQLLLMLSNSEMPISFELIATATQISIQFTCRKCDLTLVENQLKTFFPGTIIEIVSKTDNDESRFNSRYIAVSDYGLNEEFMRPVKTTENFSNDPYLSLFGILNSLEDVEIVIIQILFSGTTKTWAKSIIDSVVTRTGESFFVNAPEMVPLAKEKIRHSLFAVAIRALSFSNSLQRSKDLLKQTSYAISSMSKSSSNSLVPLNNSDNNIETQLSDIFNRQSRRTGMILNSRELATFVHLPSIELSPSKLTRIIRKTKIAPTNIESHTFKLGQNINQGIERSVTLSNEQRLKHTHIIGATGTGKSTLLLNMICQDIENGEGVAVLDPHGDLIESILSRIPKSRIEEVVIIDPSDSDYPVGFNILKAHSDIEKEVLSSDLVAAFKRLSTSWGDQMNSVFANAILAFLESSKGGTLADVRRFLIEKPYREQFLSTVKDPNVIYYWQKEYPLLKTSSVGPILTRLDSFLRPRLIRNMVTQQKGINFNEILNTKKILLVKLSQGLIGTENSFLLGTFVVSKIHQAALARQAGDFRSDFFLYIDEFQNFITPSMSHILSGARKFHLGLVLAHQDMQQLQKYDSELLNTLVTNAGTRICFRLGDTDARKLADGFSFFDSLDLQNLNTGEAIVRIERPEHDFSLSTIPFEGNQDYASQESIINYSRKKYGTPRQEVERHLNESINVVREQTIRQERKEEVVFELNKPNTCSSIPVQDKPVDIKADEVLASTVKKKEKTQHRYLQTLIKKIAESNGYKADIEMPTPDGKGKVDVSLEREGVQIAVEVSVTTSADWETHNIKKCIQAGYETVLVCTTDIKAKRALQDKVFQNFDEASLKRILVLEPDELFLYFEKTTASNLSTETKMKGYRVKVDYEAISDESMNMKRESIAKVVTDSLRKLKK